VKSTTVSRGVRISGSNAGYTVFRGSVKGTGYPLHSPVSPSLPLPCVTACHHISTGLLTVVESIPWLGLLRHTLANGALVYWSQGGGYRAEGCKTLGSDCSVVKDPLGEPGRTPFYVDLPSAGGSVNGDLMLFLSVCRRASFGGLRQTYMNELMNEWMNRIPSPDKWLWWRSIPVRGDPVREHGGGSLSGELWEKDNKRYIKRDVKMLCKRLSLSLGAPIGNLEEIRFPGFFEKKG
jgi:hypothetical protein